MNGSPGTAESSKPLIAAFCRERIGINWETRARESMFWQLTGAQIVAELSEEKAAR